MVTQIGYTILAVFFGLLIFSEVRQLVESDPEYYLCFDIDGQSAYVIEEEELIKPSVFGYATTEAYELYVRKDQLTGCIKGGTR